MIPHDVLRVSTLEYFRAKLYTPLENASAAIKAAHPPRSEDADAFGPALQPRVENDLIWKWIGVTCCNWRNMILIAVDSIYYLECGLSQCRSHSP